LTSLGLAKVVSCAGRLEILLTGRGLVRLKSTANFIDSPAGVALVSEFS